MNMTELKAAITEINNEANLKELNKQELEFGLLLLQVGLTMEPQLTVAQAMSRKLREARVRYENGIDNGDLIAKALRGMEPNNVVAAAERILDLEQGELSEKYAKLNPGQRRMNAGNRIRGAIKRGDLVSEEVLLQLH